MAVIKCPHCKKMMSSTLDVCPECGYKLTEEAQKDAGEAGKSKGRKWVIVMAALLVVVAGVVAGIVTYNNIRAEQKAFDRLQGSANLQWYEQYMLQFPDGKHIQEVKELYEVVKQEHDIFYAEVYSGGHDVLLQYINENPESPYVKMCEARLDSVDWSDATKLNTKEAYDQYLAFHPQGFFADAATDARLRAVSMEVNDEEKSLVRGVVENFLMQMTSGDAERLSHLLAEKFCLGDQPNASAQQVVDFYQQQFTQSDIQGVHFVVDENATITKHDAAMPGLFDYSVSGSVKAMVSRTNVDSTAIQQMVLKADVTSDHRLKSFSLKQGN